MGLRNPFCILPRSGGVLTQRMQELKDKGWHGIKSPTKQEMTTIVAYLEKHARQ